LDLVLALVLNHPSRRFYKQPVIGNPRACTGHASALVGSKLFYLAGAMFDSGLDDLSILDTENFTWSAVKVPCHPSSPLVLLDGHRV
jgi:hypothetical protein